VPEARGLVPSVAGREVRTYTDVEVDAIGEAAMNGMDRGWITFSGDEAGVAGVLMLLDAIRPFPYHAVQPEYPEGAIDGGRSGAV
jgi:hypothetical protein